VIPVINRCPEPLKPSDDGLPKLPDDFYKRLGEAQEGDVNIGQLPAPNPTTTAAGCGCSPTCKTSAERRRNPRQAPRLFARSGEEDVDRGAVETLTMRDLCATADGQRRHVELLNGTASWHLRTPADAATRT
jgi:hypothetical protein